MASGGVETVRHIVMIKLKSREHTDIVVEKLRELEKGISGVTMLSFNIVTDLGLVDTNSDVALIIDFPDKENYLTYSTHPDHLKVVAANKPFAVGRSAIQFSLGSKL